MGLPKRWLHRENSYSWCWTRGQDFRDAARDGGRGQGILWERWVWLTPQRQRWEGGGGWAFPRRECMEP